jgi:hypothetical protein
MAIENVEAWRDDYGFLYATKEDAERSERTRKKDDIISEIFPIDSYGKTFEIGLEIKSSPSMLAKVVLLAKRLESEGLI